jgi:hypothetical protein
MDLGPVDRITIDAVGEPGSRVFYLQARHGAELVTVVVEKEQMQLLGASILELLSNVETETGLEEPIEPRWRAGRLSIGFEEERDLFLLEIEELQPELDEDDPSRLLVDEPDTVRLWASREQMLALSRHGAVVAERGRPACQFCGNPLDPEGHTCPAMNGHRERA